MNKLELLLSQMKRNGVSVVDFPLQIVPIQYLGGEVLPGEPYTIILESKLWGFEHELDHLNVGEEDPES